MTKCDKCGSEVSAFLNVKQECYKNKCEDCKCKSCGDFDDCDNKKCVYCKFHPTKTWSQTGGGGVTWSAGSGNCVD